MPESKKTKNSGRPNRKAKKEAQKKRTARSVMRRRQKHLKAHPNDVDHKIDTTVCYANGDVKTTTRKVAGSLSHVTRHRTCIPTLAERPGEVRHRTINVGH